MKKNIITFIAILCTISLFAQEADTTKENSLNTLNVKATSIRNTITFGQKMTIKKSDITFYNPQSSAHLLENTGEVLVQRSQGGGGSPIIRGFEANKVLLVVDGVRMNNAIYRGGHLQNIITLDPNMLDNAQVLFGSNSLLYGSDALGGVMYFQSKKPQLATDKKTFIAGSAMTRYATANQEKTVHADVNLGFKKIASLTSFTYSDFGDLKTGSNFNSKYGDWGKRTFYVERFNNKDSIVKNSDVSLQKGTAYKQYDVMEKIMFQQNENTSHSLNFQYSNSSDIPRYDRLTETDSKGNPAQAQWYYGPQKRLMAAYHFENNRTTTISDKIQIVAAYQDIEESRNSRSYGSSKLTQRTENVKVISLNADLQKMLGKQTFNYGLEVQSNDVSSVANALNVNTGAVSAASTRYPDGGSKMNAYALYLTDRYKKSANTEFNVGLRYNYTTLNAIFKDKTFYPFPFDEMNQKYGALVASLGFSQQFQHGFSLNGSISTAYRAPNVDDAVKVFESAAGKLIIPNSDLKAEKTLGVELQLTKKFANQSYLQIVPFYTALTDALSLAATKYNGKDSVLYAGKLSAVYSTQNLASAYIYGVSAKANVFLLHNLALSAAYTYTKGRVANEVGDDTPLDHIAPAYGRIGLDYTLPKMRFSFYSLFNGEKKSSDYRLGTEDNELYSADKINGLMPAWFTLNLRASYNFTKNLSLQLGLENILDQHYRVFASGISGAGRNLSATLRCKF